MSTNHFGVPPLMESAIGSTWCGDGSAWDSTVFDLFRWTDADAFTSYISGFYSFDPCLDYTVLYLWKGPLLVGRLLSLWLLILGSSCAGEWRFQRTCHRQEWRLPSSWIFKIAMSPRTISRSIFTLNQGFCSSSSVSLQVSGVVIGWLCSTTPHSHMVHLLLLCRFCMGQSSVFWFKARPCFNRLRILWPQHICNFPGEFQPDEHASATMKDVKTCHNSQQPSYWTPSWNIGFTEGAAMWDPKRVPLMIRTNIMPALVSILAYKNI